MSTTGTPLNLTLPASGFKGWAAEMNSNLTGINSAIASINNQISALQAGASTIGPAGPKGMQYAGVWNSATAYIVDDVVTFNGSSYVAIANNTSTEPDLNVNSWEPLALAGAAGPTGATGPAGPSGSGAGVTFPITVAEGGTGAITAPLARTALSAAASGVNSDITQLLALVPPPGLTGTTAAIQITSAGDAQGIEFTDGTNFGGITTSGDAFLKSVSMPGGLTCGTAIISGVLQIGTIGNAVGGQPVTIAAPLEIDLGLTVDGATPAVASGKIGFGTTLSTTANAGGLSALPSTVLGYLVVNIGGDAVKIPYYA